MQRHVAPRPGASALPEAPAPERALPDEPAARCHRVAPRQGGCAPFQVWLADLAWRLGNHRDAPARRLRWGFTPPKGGEFGRPSPLSEPPEKYFRGYGVLDDEGSRVRSYVRFRREAARAVVRGTSFTECCVVKPQ